MSELRTEIVELEKARTDLLKWKLIGVAALGAAGLGFTEHQGGGDAYLVLALIPLVCFYVDLLCRHITLRVMVIGRFLRQTASGQEAAYEWFCTQSSHMGAKQRTSAFALEDWALEWSTYLLSGMVVLAGAGFSPPGLAATDTLMVFGWPMSSAGFVRAVFVASGAVAIVLSWITRGRYARRIRMLDTLAGHPRVLDEVWAIIAVADKAEPPADVPS